MATRYEINKLDFFKKVDYRPHSEAQHSYHFSNARFRCPCCGRRFGKSLMAGIDECVNLITPRDTADKYLSWIVGPTYDLAEKEFRVIWNTLIVKLRLGLDKRVKKMYHKPSGQMWIEFPWNTRVEVRSATNPDTLVGEGLNKVIMSEAAKHSEETWARMIRPALADKRGRADFPTTPEGHNWLYEDIWKHGKNPDFPDYASWNFPSWMNTALFPGGINNEEIQLLKATMGEEEFMQEIGANFASFAGKIYREFDENVHVKKHVFNPAWKNYVFIDFGFVNKFAAIDVQIDPQERIYIWREHYESYKTVPENLAIMKARDQPDGYHIDWCFGDAADPKGTLEVNQFFAPCISMPEAKENWREGIDQVKRFLKMRPVGVDEWGAPIEEPGLTIDHSCVATIKEFNLYRKKKSVLTQDANKAGSAQKVDDHIMDALRYGLMHIFVLGCTSHLAETVEPLTKRESGLLVPNDYGDGGMFTFNEAVGF